MKTNKNFLLSLLVGFFTVTASHAADLDSKLSLTVKDSPLKTVLEAVAVGAGLKLAMDFEPASTITIMKANATAKEVLDLISIDQQIEYVVSGNQLIITKRTLSPGGAAGNAKLIPIQYGTAGEIATKLTSTLGTEDRLLVDDRTNNLIFIGSPKSYEKIVNLVSLFDASPKQIIIEAQIVETSNQFLRDIGVSLGDLSDRTLTNSSRATGFSANAGPTTPNVAFKALLGHLDARALDLRLTAAETEGQAKVVSRPKVVTLNNQRAKIESGITYHVKTLSNVSSGSSTATGSLTTVDAGLSVTILPTIVGDNQIKLAVSINNSQPDEGTAVDGIPGVLKNSAETSVIVKNGQTAIIAGLVKHSKSESGSGVPILKDIPVLGFFFRSSSVSDRNNELVIFITPTIDDPLSIRTESKIEIEKK